MNWKFTYEELLALPQWQEKRVDLLKRAKNICEKCSNIIYERDSFYGPYFFSAVPNSSYFFAFNDLSQQVVHAWYPKCDREKVMLYCLKHRPNGISDNPENGFFIAAARRLNELEIEYYLNPWFSGKIGAKITEAVIAGKPLSSVQMPEKKEIAPRPDQSHWLFAKDLHIHHTYYQIDKLPWEYPDSSLQVLCRSCHEEVHRKDPIPILDSSGVKIGNYKPCYRCSGAGWFPEYKHVQNGICFACRGTAYLSPQYIK
jgi:hypothetical protein